MDLHIRVFGKNITDIILGGQHDDNYAMWLIDDTANRWMLERYIESVKSPQSYGENIGKIVDRLTEEYYESKKE
jgi:hypothetical protein